MTWCEPTGLGIPQVSCMPSKSSAIRRRFASPGIVTMRRKMRDFGVALDGELHHDLAEPTQQRCPAP
jgi:hypothetical protein